MEELKAVPRKIYWFVLGLIDMILIFFYSIFNLTKPSDTLTREDVDRLRRNRPPTDSGNDYRYKGKRSSQRVYMGGWGGGWAYNSKSRHLLSDEDFLANSNETRKSDEAD